MEVKIIEVIQVFHKGLGEKYKDSDWVTFYTKQGDQIASSPLTARFRAALEGKHEAQDSFEG